MTRKNLISSFFLLFLLFVGFLYLYFIQVDILNVKVLDSNHTKVDFTIDSKIAQNIKLHVKTKDELRTIYCEDKKQQFIYYRIHDYKQEEEVSVRLKQGVNHCQLQMAHLSSSLPLLKQKISSIDFLLLFIFFILPFFHLLFTLLITLLNKIWNKENV